MGFLSDISDALSGGLGDLAGGLISGGLGYLGTQSANSANVGMSQAQMSFQERMDNTKYQRAVKDLQAAGLNPMMAYGNMSAGTPSGSVGPAQQSALSSAVEGFNRTRGTTADVTSKSVQNKLLEEQVKQANATTSREIATAENLHQQTKTGASQEVLNAAATAAQVAQSKASTAQAALAAAQAKSVIDDNAKKAMMSNVYDIGEQITGWAKDKVQKLNSAISTGVSIKNRNDPRNITIYGSSTK